MLWKRIKLFWKSGLAIVISLLLMLAVSGCSDTSSKEAQVEKNTIEIQNTADNSEKDTEKIIDICLDLYEKAAQKNRISDLETIRSIINRFGENGYAAIDNQNQIDMTHAEQVVEFCKKVDTQEEAEITIIEIDYLGGFVKYDLQTKEGNVDVVKSYYEYNNGTIQRNFIGSYQAEDWNYTKEGYLMFSGVYFSEDLHVLTLSGMEEYTALRVEPLDETCRDLTRKYLLPISFERNNMFIEDWSENDFGELNFYDMYDILYQKENGEYVPYAADDNLGVRAVYQIPKEEFESVIMKSFNIDHKTLQSKTVYDSEDSTYEYKPRGFQEVEYPEYPYSEVVGFTENSDGTITLTANVVFPYASDSKVYAHEVVIRPLKDDGVQYVSNRIIPSEDNSEETWHTPRLTAEEVWEPPAEIDNSETVTEEEADIETSKESAYWLIPQSSDCLISEDEKKQLQSTVLSAADSVKEIYKDVIIADAANYSSGVSAFSSEQRKSVVEQLRKIGLVSIAEDTNMQNSEGIETFYKDYLSGQDSMVTVFEVQRDGLIGAVTFIYREEQLQTYYIGVRWKEGGMPEIQGTSVSNVAEIKLTEKGYFIYAYEYVIAHASLRQYWRTKPLSEDCRKLTEKYILGLPSLDKGTHGRTRVNLRSCIVTFAPRTSGTRRFSALQGHKFISFRLFDPSHRDLPDFPGRR